MKNIDKFGKQYDLELTEENLYEWKRLLLIGVKRLFEWDDYSGMDDPKSSLLDDELLYGNSGETVRCFLQNLNNDYDWDEVLQIKSK